MTQICGSNNVLAHFIADYPLQTNRLVEAKKRWPGLTLHVFIHLVTMIVIIGRTSLVVWPYLLVLAVTHFGIDTLKNNLSQWRSQWIIGPYLFDQFLHLLSIGAVAILITTNIDSGLLPSKSLWIVYAIGYLLVTYVWFITERILTHDNSAYLQAVNPLAWSRMVGRTFLLSGLLLAWSMTDAMGIAMLPIIRWPYSSGKYGGRTLIIDISVSLVGVIYIKIGLYLM